MSGALRGLVAGFAVLVLGCSGGGTPSGPLPVPPSALVYGENPAVYVKGVAISRNTPSASGDPITHFSVSPGLPPGLALDPDNGSLAGTPTALAALATYTVTGANAGGSASAPLVLTVNDAAPAFGYGAGSFTFTTGLPVSLAPVQTGGPVVAWSVQPALPAGLALDAQDGSLAGTPSAIVPSSSYAITGSNTGGTQVLNLTLRTLPPAPSISAQPSDATATVGGTATFSVTASGTGSLAYQWSKDGVDLPGATAPSCTTGPVLLADSGARYRVTVSDAYGSSATSAAATLTASADLTAWLTGHPGVAAALRWQFRPANLANSYQAPADTDKIDWPHWSQGQKNDLEQAFQAAMAWFAQGAAQVAMDPSGLTDEPVNQHPQTTSDTVSVMQWVTPAYAWKLYLAHVAFALAQEIAHPLPWSLLDDSPESLRYLFDSSVMAWYLPNGNYGMGTYGGANFPPLRADNRPQTAFAPPMWTYPWLRQAGLMGATRQETIGKVLEWMRQNMVHFYGQATFGTYSAVWQYRGWVPLSKLVAGTVDASNPGLGSQHWTAGCHGSVGFLHEVLRVVNIPVQPVWVGGHELACFVSERTYLDHGDDPYNLNVRAHPDSPILGLLIDEPTYQAWFTGDLAANITAASGPAVDNIGRAAREFH